MRSSVLAVSLLLAAPLAAPLAAQRGDVEVRRFASLAEAGLDPRALPALPFGPVARSARSGARPAIMLTGYWPPSNEAIRPFSPNPAQNPGGWIGQDWEGLGYDVYAFFPEFADPTCDDCGQGTGDLEVDYQDTSLDFWTFADQLEPIAIVTFSRGFLDHSWELELNQYNRDSWLADYTAPKQPTPSPPNPSQPADALLPSVLPMQHVFNEVKAAHPTLDPFMCLSEDGGGFLSEYAAYHGVWYQDEHDDALAPDWCVAAGHVHVGGLVDWPTAQAAAQTTVRAVIDWVDANVAPGPCQPDLGFAGPGEATLRVCGDLGSGGTADLVLEAPPQKPGWLFVSTDSIPVPLAAGTLAAFPFFLADVMSTGPQGQILMFDIPGGTGPLTLYAQFLYLDFFLQGSAGFSNAVEIEFLP